jgi:hypothetical protein
LDEGVSGKRLPSLLEEAKLPFHIFESLFPKNKRVPDPLVIEAASAARYIIVSTDKRMETVWMDDLIRHKAKVILLIDQDSGPIHWAVALIAGQSAWERALLDHPNDALIIKLSRSGKVKDIVSEEELKQRLDDIMTVKITQAKQAGKVVKAGVIKQNN